MTRRNWSKEEEVYLQDSWGNKSIKAIAKALDRSVDSVKNKASEIGLGDPRMNFNGITVCQLGKALNREYSVLKAWINRYGMPVRRKVFCQSSKVLVISYDDFWKWAEQHKELLNLAKMEPGMLGKEPEWAKIKRRADTLRSQRTWQSMGWDAQEDQRLRQLLKTKGITYPKLSKLLNRSEPSIRRRIYDLHIKDKPERSSKYRYTDAEVEKLRQMAEQGYGYETIAQELGKSALGIRGKLERMNFDFKQRRFR